LIKKAARSEGVSDLVKKPKKNGDLDNIYIEVFENAGNTDKSTHHKGIP